MIFYFSRSLCAQNIYELRKLTDDQWISMSTEERLNALSKANKHAQNQTFVGDFGKFYDLHKRWGYEFYEMEDRYDNYSFRGFENYNIIEERRRRWSYNEFGDRLVKMTSSGNIWHETYEGDGTFYVEMPNRYFNAMTAGEVDGGWVAREATDDWAFSAIGAGAIRTKFTPLTLSLPNMHGMRLDFQSENSTMAIVNSSLLGSQDFWDLSSQDFIGGYRDYDVDLNAKNTKLFNKGGALLRGGYFRQKFGALTVGASYVNEYGVQGNREGGDSWYGTVSNYAPTPIIVALRFMDDSPADGEGGPIIYDVRLKVNDKYRDDIIPVIMRDDVTRDRTTAFFSIGDQAYVRPEASVNVGKPKEDILSLEGMIPKYADFFFLRDYLNGSKPSNVKDKFNLNLADKYYAFVDPGSASIVINGTETVVYFFDLASIKEHANRVEAEITVANDYRIQTALIYPKDIKGGHDTSGKYASYYNATYWRTMAQAEGNVKDKSNVDHLTVDFGLQVASIVYGLDIDFNYREFKITGEYVTNASHVTVEIVRASGKVEQLPHIVRHSPDGFEWGYSGSGPTDLALAICAAVLGEEPTRLRQIDKPYGIAARDGVVYVCAVYSQRESCVIDQYGMVLVSAGGEEGVYCADVDLTPYAALNNWVEEDRITPRSYRGVWRRVREAGSKPSGECPGQRAVSAVCKSSLDWSTGQSI